jgi:Zn-dependent protease
MISPIFDLIVSFTIALILHEFGHLVAAKFCSVPVTAVGLGWGPKLCSRSLRNIDCQLRLLPFGAFVRMDMRALQARPLHQQLFVLGAGVVMNLILCALTWGSTFSLVNLALAVGNILPLYQHDGWKSCLVISRRLIGHANPVIEWSITICGALGSLGLIAKALNAF